MASLTFTEILEKELGKTLGKRPSQKAIIESALKVKALSLKSTILKRADDDISDGDILSFFKAADSYVESILDEQINKDLDELLGDSFTRNKKDTVKIERIRAIRDKQGRGLSALNLAVLLNSTLYYYVKPLMKKPALVWRTGRLANSGKILRVEEGLGEKGSIMFTYMLNPYSVFEDNKYRSPTVLFKKAIDNALASILSPKSLQFDVIGPR